MNTARAHLLSPGAERGNKQPRTSSAASTVTTASASRQIVSPVASAPFHRSTEASTSARHLHFPPSAPPSSVAPMHGMQVDPHLPEPPPGQQQTDPAASQQHQPSLAPDLQGQLAPAPLLVLVPDPHQAQCTSHPTACDIVPLAPVPIVSQYLAHTQHMGHTQVPSWNANWTADTPG